MATPAETERARGTGVPEDSLGQTVHERVRARGWANYYQYSTLRIFLLYVSRAFENACSCTVTVHTAEHNHNELTKLPYSLYTVSSRAILSLPFDQVCSHPRATDGRTVGYSSCVGVVEMANGLHGNQMFATLVLTRRYMPGF